MNEDIQKQIDILNRRVDLITKNPQLPDHYHTGYDASRVNWADIYQRKVYLYWTVPGTSAATAANYGVFFIVPFICVLTKFQEVHQTLGTDAGAVTLDLEKLTGTQALDAGVSMLNTTLSLKATINSVQTATLTNTLANRNLAVGDRLALKDAGTLTAVANVTVYAELQIT